MAVQVKDLNTLRLLPYSHNFDKNDFYYVEENQMTYKYNSASQEFEKITAVSSIDTGMTVYDFNVNIMNQMPNATEDQIEEFKTIIQEFQKEHPATYYMLLCKEQSYFTLFKKEDGMFNMLSYYDPLKDNVIDCIQELGTLKSVVKNDFDVELWVSVDSFCCCAHLFPYDEGVVIYQGE